MISLLIVNFRAAALAAEAIRSARAATTLPLRVIVVDNSLDAFEAEKLRDHADVVTASPLNGGYSGGINRGIVHCKGEFVIVANPDVVFAPRSIDRLIDAFRDSSVAMAGPALFWDDGHQWRLPPADAHTLRSKLDEVAASRSMVHARRRDQMRIRQRIAFWSLRETTPVKALSGAVMAIRLADFQAAGGFDERFRLYFEETDFIRRVRERGRSVVYVPEAHCRHVYDQSAGQVRLQSAMRYAESERRYFRKWNGLLMPKVIRLLARDLERGFPEPPQQRSADLPEEGLVVETSPLRSFTTAAGVLDAPRDVALPDDVWSAFRGPVLYFRAIEANTGRVLGVWSRTKG